jgi:hypothetical protein
MAAERRRSEKKGMQEFFQAVRHPQANMTYEEFVELFTKVLWASYERMVAQQQRKECTRRKRP